MESKLRYCFPLLALLGLAACSHKGPLAAATPAVVSPYAVTNKVYQNQADSFAHVLTLQQPALLTDSAGAQVPSQWVGTVNFGMRKPNYVIIHFTAQDSVQQTLHTFTITSTQVSAHYVIAKDGTVFHMVNDYLRANQAGLGKWSSVSDMNSCSIGIEIDNNGNEPYTDGQIKSLLILLDKLKRSYNIPTANFIGHQDWAPKRKPDPGPLFPWQKLAEKGFGYWSDEVLELPPDNFDYITALRLIGYDVSDVNAAIVAFKRHFVQTDNSPQMTQLDLNVLYNVSKKY
ncbi:N-acetylmuramoyl-L-alanine amidase [Mucilaginibacter yixingensis]|uniref:N-acetylmuramoyl-L-alanine amidase n=1 Tax=Mucilaginibacter yixingensis TaxID=1295612 RepID=A0A2T5JE82_9SPHI|nr:N-acetylmuramoyl-L-alanine amidase [Mucilaginibacter yixingensis]PTR00064.1 N-acetylmuramoyl-L-alanine amidase [Mucilaginibacter yixingensis]